MVTRGNDTTCSQGRAPKIFFNSKNAIGFTRKKLSKRIKEKNLYCFISLNPGRKGMKVGFPMKSRAMLTILALQESCESYCHHVILSLATCIS